MTGISLHPLASAAVGAACAVAGVYAVPPDPERAEMDGALLRTGVATAAACAWALWRDEVGATLVPFVATTFRLGEVRMRALRKQTELERAARPPRGLAAAPLPAQPPAQPSSSPSSSPSRGSSR